MTKPGYTGIKRIRKAAGYSSQGIRAAWQHESAFRQECAVAALLLPCAVVLAETWLQLAVLITVCVLVLIAELLNSAVEAVVDRIGHEHNDLAGQAKDMASAAVALAIFLVPLIWGLVALERFVGYWI
ncbi:MAG: diacylglycerol kinase [Pseudomonadales bacterium]|nr:diacylglycerol kinase [Pseudomonadales bacterium]NIX09584.1 diacylglycerol kinase [Pseudomonadales bacterium]